MSERDKEIEELKAQLESYKAEQHKKSTWFSRLSSIGKVFATITGIIVGIPVISGTVVSMINYFFSAEIEEYNHIKESVKKIELVEHKIDSVANQFKQGSSYYAVGYRAGRDGDGQIKKFYRDWDGTVHRVYPDPFYSDSTRTYYYYITSDGTKHWCFTK